MPGAGSHQLPVVVSNTFVAVVWRCPAPQYMVVSVVGLKKAAAGISVFSLMFAVKPWLEPSVVDASVAPPSHPCCKLTSPYAPAETRLISTHVAGMASPRCTVPVQPVVRGTNVVTPLSTETVFNMLRLSSALFDQNENDFEAPLLVRRTPAPLHVAARGSKRDLSERGIHRLEVSERVGAERTGAMVERARQRERTDLSVPDAK